MTDGIEFTDVNSLDQTLLRRKDQVFAVSVFHLILTVVNNRFYFFILIKIQEVHHRNPLARTGGIRNLVCLDPVNLTVVREEAYKVMGMHLDELFHNVFAVDAHTLDTLTAAVLCPVRVTRDSLDISVCRHGNQDIFLWNQIFVFHIEFVLNDIRSSVIAVFVS